MLMIFGFSLGVLSGFTRVTNITIWICIFITVAIMIADGTLRSWTDFKNIFLNRKPAEVVKTDEAAKTEEVAKTDEVAAVDS